MQDRTPLGYRIKKQRNNYLNEDQLQDDEDVFKMSIHSSSNKSPNKQTENRSKRNASTANRINDAERISHRSKRSPQLGKSNASSNSLSGSRRTKQSENNNQGHIKQFANVKQLLMIKAYDKKLFRKVTASNQANRNFLKLGDIRTDPFRKQTFKVMIENFKEITIRIRHGYNKVLNKILFQQTNTSAIVTLAHVQPLLEKVKQQSDMMYYKLKECLDAHDAREFRHLLLKFQTFLNAASQIQQIILIVSESKHKIDNLFKNLEKQNHLDDKVNHERKKGIKKVRNAVKDYGDDGVQAKILDKVQAAINQMADKTLEAYSKVTGVRGLMMRIKQCLKQNKQFYELDDILKMNQIFKQVLHEAQSYERFADKFMEEGDIINDDLRQCILKYKQEIQINRDAVSTMQMKFISNVLEASVQTFEANYSVCNALDSEMTQDFEKMNGLLQSICGLISNQNIKATIKSMLKQINHKLKQADKLIKKLKRVPKSIAIDTQEGYANLQKIQQLVNNYKSTIFQMIEREQRAHRQITKRKIKRQNIDQVDLQQKCISKVIQLSKKLNDSNRKTSIQNCKAFHQIGDNNKIERLSSEIGDIKFYKQFKSLSAEVQELSHANQIGSLVQSFVTESSIYQISSLLVDLHQIGFSTSESKILQNLQSISSKYKASQFKGNQMLQMFMQRLLAVVLSKGLDRRTVRRIDNNRQIQFPENQHDVQSLRRDTTYLKTVSSLLPASSCKTKVQQTYNVMEQLIEGIRISEHLKWNHEQLYYVDSEKIFKMVENMFETCFKVKCKQHEQETELTNFHNKLKKIHQNLNKAEHKQKTSGYSTTRVQKVLQVISKYQNINNKMMQQVKKIQNLQKHKGYAHFVFYLCEYLKSTCQSYYAALNKNNNVIWVSKHFDQPSKLSHFGSIIGLSQLKAGEISQKYNQKSPIIASKKEQKPQPVPQPKNVNKNSKKQAIQDEMGEQINEQTNKSGQIADDIMDENIDQQASQPMQDMQQQMGDEVQDEMADQVGDQVADQIENQQGMILEADQNIIDDFQDAQFIGSKKKQNRPSAAKKEHPTINTTQKPQTTISNSNTGKAPVVQQVKKQEEPAVVIKQKKAKYTFQIFKYIETLEDLEKLISKIKNLRNNFWKKVDMKIVESYFNRDGKVKEIQKNLNNELDKFIKGQFVAEFQNSIKQQQDYKTVKTQIQQLQCQKYASLWKILKSINVKYSWLIGFNKQLIKLSIKDTQKWQPSSCIKQYIKTQLSISGLNPQIFNFGSYLDQLITNSLNLQTKYQLSDKTLQLKGQQIKIKINQCQKIFNQYEDFSKFPDGINLHETIVNMWLNCLSSADNGKIEIKISDKLIEDLKKLQLTNNYTNYLYYFNNLKDKGKILIDNLQKHKKKLQKIFSSLNKDNLFESINELVLIYKCNASTIITYENKPVIVRQSTTSTKSNPKQQIVKLMLIPEDKNQNTLNPQKLRQKLKKKPQLYAQHRQQICSILSLLQIQSHIWPSPIALNISQTRDQTINTIISYASNGIIKDAPEQLQNMQEINNCIKVINPQPFVFQYVVKDNQHIMDRENNIQYYKQVNKVLDSYQNKRNIKYQVADTIFESLAGIQDGDSSITSQVFDFTETLSLILKEKLFTQNWKTIFSNHIPTQNKIDEMKLKIDGQVRLLLSIVQDPIEITENPIQAMDQIQSKIELVCKWFKEYKQKQKKDLQEIKICLCTDQKCDKQYSFFVGETKNHLQDYFKKLNISHAQLGKNFENKSTSTQFLSSTVFHAGKSIANIGKKLSEVDQALMQQFITQYNLVHIVKKQEKNRKLAQLKQKLLKLNSRKSQILKCVQDVIVAFKNNHKIQRFIQQQIKALVGKDLTQMNAQQAEQKQKLTEINVNNTQYSKFGNWVVNIVGKIYKFPLCLLMDKYNNQEMLCIIVSKDDQQIKKCLKSLQLPTQFNTVETKPHFKKIQLDKQSFSFKLDGSCITKQQLTEFSSENYGIVPPDDGHIQTLVIGIYQIKNEDDIDLLTIELISSSLLELSKDIPINLNQNSIKNDIQIKILQVKYKSGQKIIEDNILRQRKSQKHSKISINSVICASSLSKWLKAQLVKLREKKQIELQQFILQEKQERELREAKQKKQREQKQQTQRLKAQAKAKQQEEDRLIKVEAERAANQISSKITNFYINEEDQNKKITPNHQSPSSTPQPQTSLNAKNN